MATNFLQSKDFRKYQQFLTMLRDQGTHKGININKPCDVAFTKELSHHSGKTVQKMQIIFVAQGCVKALSKEAPCTMCGFINESNFGKYVLPKDLMHQFDYAVKQKGFKKSSIVTLLNSGSIFPEMEFPKVAREYIFKKLNGYAHIKEVLTESRPEFVNEKVIKETKELLKNKKVELSFGLEAATDIVRDQFINKGFSKKDFEKAVKIAHKYKIDTHCYVLLKPPFLTESEAIDEAVKTIKYCFKKGVFGVTLMPCGVQKNTLTEFLYKNNEYRPPWLWSVIEVIRKTKNDGYVRLDTREENVQHLSDPHNCSKCNVKVVKAFDKYNIKHDLEVFDKLDCECRKEWQKDLKIKNTTPFNKRIKKFLEKHNL